MSLDVSKGQLGAGYLFGTGTLIAVALLVSTWRYAADPETAAVLLSGVVPATGLASTRYWLPEFDLSAEQVWSVAVWGGFGLAVLTAVDTVIVLLHYLAVPVLDTTSSLLVSNVTAGGIAGVLVGLSIERDRDAKTVAERNSVLNRVLRHDLRNECNVIKGHADLLAEEVDGGEEHIAVIRRKADRIVSMGETARKLERELANESREPVDAAAVVREQVQRVADANPDAYIETSLPPAAWVRAGDMLGVAVDHLLENAVVHANADPKVVVSVAVEAGRVEVRVADDGPGIPTGERRPVEDATETPLGHTSGLGLWTVKWLAEHYGGEMHFEQSNDGTVVCLSLPRQRAGTVPSPVSVRQ